MNARSIGMRRKVNIFINKRIKKRKENRAENFVFEQKMLEKKIIENIKKKSEPPRT